MKIFFILSTLVAAVFGQFGGLGGLPGGSHGGRLGGAIGGLTKPLAAVADLKIPGLEENWSSFLVNSGRKYASAAEETLRKNIFALNSKKVLDHNEIFKAGKSTFELGINQFSDLKPEEVISKLTGRKKTSGGGKHKNKASPPADVAETIPDSFDWRTKGAVTPIKFQGLECGACWTFAVTGAIEGHTFRKTGKLVTLSEQNLVDCADKYGNTGCDGGYQEYGFDYVLDNHGIDKADTYPYIEKQETCKYNEANIGATIQGYSVIPPGNETMMKKVIATLGPIAASVDASPDTFVLYKSGVYKDSECNKDGVNHSILIVGYGTENGEDYWIIKNSWTEKWGENGYMKLARNANNFCGIASECSYPIV